MDTKRNVFKGGLDGIITNSHPCNMAEDIQATITINEKMKKLESEFRSKSVMSGMATRGFVYTT